MIKSFIHFIISLLLLLLELMNDTKDVIGDDKWRSRLDNSPKSSIKEIKDDFSEDVK